MAPVQPPDPALSAPPAQPGVVGAQQIAHRPSAHCRRPRWSADGQKLAFSVYEGEPDEGQTWTMAMPPPTRPEDAEASVVVLGHEPGPVVDFAWQPACAHGVMPPYVAAGLGPHGLYDLYADGAWLDHGRGKVHTRAPSWSRACDFLAFTVRGPRAIEIEVLQTRAGGPARPVTLTQSADEVAPLWSPTGARLLFVRYTSGSPNGHDLGVILDVTRPQTSTHMLTDWPGDEVAPAWSPDGKQVAFLANRDTEHPESFDLWVIHIDGSRAQKLATRAFVAARTFSQTPRPGPVWSPDGARLFYVHRSTDGGPADPIRWHRLDGSAHGTLATGTQWNRDLAMRPAPGRGDALTLAFAAYGRLDGPRVPRSRLYVHTFKLGELNAEIAVEPR